MSRPDKQPAATDRSSKRERTPSAQACASTVLDVVPAVMDALRAAMREHAAEQLSVPQFRCLNFIALHPGCSLGAVAAFLGVTMPTASAMVERLVRAGSVAPGVALADRRRAELHPTPAGLSQLSNIREGAHQAFARTLSACSGPELATLNDGLKILQRAFSPT